MGSVQPPQVTSRGVERYSVETKRLVKLRYPACRNTEEKLRLAAELNIVDEAGQPSLGRIYNLASRLKASGDAVAPLFDERELLKADPATHVFAKAQDEKLRSWFGKEPGQVLALHLGVSEAAILYRARQLGLRTFTHTFQLSKVAIWTGLTPEELRAATGLEIRHTFDRNRSYRDELITAASLARWLDKPETLSSMRDPDRFFLLEIEEMVADSRARGKVAFERCKFLSAGHVCHCPYALSYGLFCTNNALYTAGDDPKCPWRTVPLSDLSDPIR
jgi:hypothetical protein